MSEVSHATAVAPAVALEKAVLDAEIEREAVQAPDGSCSAADGASRRGRR